MSSFQVLDASQLYTSQEIDLELFKQNVQLFRHAMQSDQGKVSDDLIHTSSTAAEENNIAVTCP